MGHVSAGKEFLSEAEDDKTPAPPAPARLRAPRPWPAPTAWVLAVIAAFACNLQLARTRAVNSDGAGNALQAWDMLHGNLLLHGWMLSDVSFYTTELPQYMIVELVRGLNQDVVEDLERTKKFGSAKVCLGSSFAEHNRMKRNLFHFKYFFLWKRRKEEEELIRTTGEAEWVEEILKVLEENENENRKRAISPFVYTKKLYRNSTYCSGSPFTRKIRIKRIELPTHYSEVNHRTLKAVVSYGPNIGHIPHDIRLKDPNLPLRSGNGRGQNI
jgi:hypothetical protein